MPLPSNGVSLLVEVNLSGYLADREDDPVSEEELPPLAFGYTSFEPETGRSRRALVARTASSELRSKARAEQRHQCC
jgi:hypothetical protein